MRKSTLFATALAVAGSLSGALAGAAAAAPSPGAGGLLQEVRPAPAPPQAIPELRVEPGAAASDAGPAGEKFLVRSLHVSGARLYPESVLIAVAGFSPDRQMDLRDLRLMAARITRFYNRHGYFVAQAYVPAQALQDGGVTIAVIEGRYGKVALDNHTNLSNGLARSVMAGLDRGDAVAIGPLQRRLLLLSDIPGVRVHSTLSPGAEVGSSDLTVGLTPGPRVSGSIDADNAGSPYSGEARLGGALNINDPTGHGDLVTLRALSSFDGLTYGSAAYQLRLQDATVGVSYALLDYKLHGTFAPLRASGTAKVASVYASYPLVRSYDDNLYLHAAFEDRRFHDKEAAIGSVIDRREDAVLIGLSGDHHDGFNGGGWNDFSLGYTFGDLDIQTPAARLIDQAGAHSNGGYGKFSYSASRLQTVAGPLQIYGLIRGQFASKNLDISEKLELGGAYAVRAYPQGLIFGDDGYVATVEARLALPPTPRPLPGRLQAIAFFDAGSAIANHSRWAVGPNHQSVKAAGVGLNWFLADDLIVRGTWAHTVGDARGVPGPYASSRAWFQITKLF